MKTYTLGISDKAMPRVLSWKEKLETAHSAGYDSVEMVIDNVNSSLKQLDFHDDQIKILREYMEKTGVLVQTIYLAVHKNYPMGSSNEKMCAKSMDILKKAVIFASELGNTAVQLPGYDVYYELSTQETEKRFMENLRQAANTAAYYGVKLGLKPMDTEFLNTVQKAAYYVEQIKMDCLEIYPDVGNITNAAKLYGNDVLKDIKTGQGFLSALQLKETLPGRYEDIPFGMGHVNFGRTIHMTWKMGVRKFAVDMNYQGNTNWRVDMMSAQNFLRCILDKLDKTGNTNE